MEAPEAWVEAPEAWVEALVARLEAREAQTDSKRPRRGDRFLRGTCGWMDGLTMLDLRCLAESSRGLAEAFTDLG